MSEFEDERLAQTDLDGSADGLLRTLAMAGARIRTEAGTDAEALAAPLAGARPRGMLALGSGARLIRAVLEPHSPSPFVAWPFEGLPRWVGSLDLVVLLAPHADQATEALLATASEAVRRGANIIAAVPPDGPLADAARSRNTALVPTSTEDELAAVVQVLAVLAHLGLGPQVSAEEVAAVADAVAIESSPHRDLAANPAKDLAMNLAEAEPLLFGGTVLAARAGRRIAEALRQASGRVALAADASELVPILTAVPERDPFADPFDQGQGTRPVLVLLDDDTGDQRAEATCAMLEALADERQVRVVRLRADRPDVVMGSPMDRYTCLLYQGLFGAAWLAIGLGREHLMGTRGRQ